MKFDYHRSGRLWLRPNFHILCVRNFPKLKKFFSSRRYKFRQALSSAIRQCLRALPKSAWRISETESKTEIMYFKPRRILRRDVIFISLTEIPYNTNYVLNNPRSSFLPHWRSKVRLLFLRTKDKQLKNHLAVATFFKHKVYSSSKSYNMLK